MLFHMGKIYKKLDMVDEAMTCFCSALDLQVGARACRQRCAHELCRGWGLEGCGCMGALHRVEDLGNKPQDACCG